MRILIWQQFASNHSNAFIVAGEFETISQAESAYHTIRNVLQRLRDGYLTRPYTFARLSDDNYAYHPTSIDNEVFEPYGILPRKMVDWASYDYEEYFVDEVLHIYDRRIYVAAFGYSGFEPFDRLVEYLGGRVDRAEDFEPGLLAVDIVCTTPNEAIAALLYEGLQAKDSEPIPWLEYLGGVRSTNANLKNQEAAYLVWKNWMVRVQGLKKQLSMAPHWQRPQITVRIHELEQNPPPIAKLEQSIERAIDQAREKVNFQREHAVITHSEKIIQCRNVMVAYQYFGMGLPAILEWMRSYGCEVNYTFHHVFFKVQITAYALNEERATQIVEELRSTQRSDLTTGLKIQLGQRDSVTVDYGRLTILLHDERILRDTSFPTLSAVHDYLETKKCKKIRHQWVVDDEPFLSTGGKI